MTVLANVKSYLTIPAAETSFDNELIPLINAAIIVAVQLGVAELEGFSVVDYTTVWPAFADPELGVLIKTYIPAKVRLVFDPTASATINQILTGYISELESRIQIEASLG